MHMTMRIASAATLAVLLGVATATPAPTVGACAGAATPMAMTAHGQASPVAQATATAHNQHASPEQQFIDMMIPHHESIIALATVALPNLEDTRLREMATAIVSTQEAEISDLRALRETRFGSAEPGPMSLEIMQDPELDAGAMIASFCSAPDIDVSFAQATLSHHLMAVDSSREFLKTSQDAELRAIAEQVIAAQNAEIAVLERFLVEHNGATPAP